MSRKRVASSSKRYIKEENKISKIRISFILLLAIIIICIISIFIKYNEKNNIKQDVKKVLNEVFIGIKECDEDKVNQYIDYKLLISSFDPMIVENNSEISIKIKKEMFKDIKWIIEDIDFNDNGAIAIIEVTNIDFKVVVTAWMKEIVSLNSSGIIITNDLALEKLLEILESDNLNTKTIIKKIKLIKQEDRWYIQLNEDFRDLVYPGIDSVITVLNENI